MTEKSQNRRKNYFIKKKFQVVFIIKFCILVIISVCISAGIIYALSRASMTTSFEDSRLVIKSTADFILPTVLLSSAVVIFCIGIATVIVTLFTSHKIAGPLYRMEKDVEEVASGNLKKKFHLRDNDELKGLADALEQMTQSLKADIHDLKISTSELETTVKECEARESDVSLKDLRDRITKMKEALEKFGT